MAWLWQGREGPRDIPQWAYMYLVTKLKINPDQLTQLKCVERMAVEEGVLLNLVRIFNPKSVGAIKVKDFTTLDEHPELILYEGCMEKVSGRVHLVPRSAPTRQNSFPVT